MVDEGKKQVVVHRNLAVIEVNEPGVLTGLFDDPRIRPLLWMRVGETCALAAPDKVSALVCALEEAGHPPHFSRELSWHVESP
ncbi:MAG: hypothetical protein JW797_12755 [Bradymonadales bacterium]|nr:hypothetical protein [Bradymonadales bacterium]